MGSGSFLKVLAKNFDVLAGYTGFCFPSPFLPPSGDPLILGCCSNVVRPFLVGLSTHPA
jgi:hypothetical protein